MRFRCGDLFILQDTRLVNEAELTSFQISEQAWSQISKTKSTSSAAETLEASDLSAKTLVYFVSWLFPCSTCRFDLKQHFIECIKISPSSHQPLKSVPDSLLLAHSLLFLPQYGIDVRAKDSQGQTAMKLAKKTASKGCIDILLQHGCPNETSPPTATPILSRRSSTASLGRTSSIRKRVS